MRFLAGLVLALSLSVSAAQAEHHNHQHDHSQEATDGASELPEVTPNQLLIQVKGLVCSFCAHGAEKSLSKLEGLDKEQFGDGVLVDIDKQRITLAMQPDAAFHVADIHRRIKKAGYDPVRFDFLVRGAVVQEGDRWALRSIRAPQELELQPNGRKLREGDAQSLRVHLDADAAASWEAGQPLPVIVDAVQ